MAGKYDLGSSLFDETVRDALADALVRYATDYHDADLGHDDAYTAAGDILTRRDVLAAVDDELAPYIEDADDE